MPLRSFVLLFISIWRCTQALQVEDWADVARLLLPRVARLRLPIHPFQAWEGWIEVANSIATNEKEHKAIVCSRTVLQGVLHF